MPFCAVYSIYKPSELYPDWHYLVQTDYLETPNKARYIQNWNRTSRGADVRSNYGNQIWVRLMVRPDPPYWLKRQELSIWKDEVLPNWEERL